jgi:hypothetical protein
MDKDMETRRSLRWMRVIGSLAPGAMPTQATAEIDPINSQLAAAHPKADGPLES